MRFLTTVIFVSLALGVLGAGSVFAREVYLTYLFFALLLGSCAAPVLFLVALFMPVSHRRLPTVYRQISPFVLWLWLATTYTFLLLAQPTAMQAMTAAAFVAWWLAGYLGDRRWPRFLLWPVLLLGALVAAKTAEHYGVEKVVVVTLLVAPVVFEWSRRREGWSLWDFYGKATWPLAAVLFFGFAAFAVFVVPGPEPQLDALFGEESAHAGEMEKYRQLPRLYDIKIDAANRLLFFSEKNARLIGRINLDDGSYRLSPQYPEHPEQIALVDDGRTVASYFRLWEKEKHELILFDAKSLAVKKRCSFVDWVDLAATPYPGFLAGIRERPEPEFSWINLERCEREVWPTDTSWPFQVLCAASGGRCYVSGWILSHFLTEVTIGEGPRPVGNRHVGLGAFALGMALDEAGRRLYVTRPLAGSVDIVDTYSLRRVGRLPSPPMVRALAVAPEHDLIFLPVYYDGIVYVKRLSDGRTLGRFRVGHMVREVIWSPEAGGLFLLSERTVWRLTTQNLLAWLAERAD
ncbi:MAG: hypothetical protein P9L99_04315 [Candidatus Lernaella stagnicola]|nr:hypothetical protein [Candidatus Lernaella stagnicola]